MTKSATRSDPVGSPSDEAGELVFIYGSLRRGGPESYRLADAEFKCPALVCGQLYEIGSSPALILASSGRFVMGDLYRSSPELLDQIAAAELPAAEREAGRFRKVLAKVRPYNLGQAEIDAWAWEWTGSPQGVPVVDEGDWLERCIPRPAPLFTSVALLCFLFIPALFLAGILIPPGVAMSELAVIALGFLWLLSPLAGLGSLWIASRRRERWRGLRPILWVLLSLASIPALLWILTMLLNLVKMLAA